ncbi:MAG: winged helix-turn-helix transcriptional regulator, partial [Lachnospiraceae bacterium]|nr:winged helix-turn-helix transcriptional regulator [Lachnospiraceae bacterium]
KKMREVLSRVLNQNDYHKVRTIIDFMEEHGEITPKEAITITGKSAATVRKYLKILKDTRYI